MSESIGIAFPAERLSGLLGKTWQYEYDAFGRKTKEVDAKNQTTAFFYTPTSDVARIDHPTEADTTFTYDAAQNLIALTDALGASGWVFDAAGRMTKQTDSLGKVLQSSYDTIGAQTALKLPGGDTVTYEYDAAGRPVLQESRWGDLAYGYDAASNLTTVLRSTGVTTQYGYDADNRVTDITHTSPGAELGCDLGANDLEVGASVNIDELIGLDLCVTVDIDIPVLTGLDYGDTIDLDYIYDPVGNVVSQTRKDGSSPAVATTYGYDNLNRLTSSAGPASNTYKYDKAGNRTQWATNKAPDTGKALTVNASYNGAGQLTAESKKRPALLGSSTVSTAYTYDANGNRTKSQTGLSSTTFKYTDDDKLAEVNQTGRKVTTGYDGLGRALTTTTQSLLILASTTTQVWDGYDVVQQSGPTGVSNLVRDVTGDVAIQTADGLLSGGDRWGLTDRLGSTIAQTSGSRVAQLATYSDWGVPTFNSVGFNSRTGYTGELGDTTAGLNHYYARSYEPMSGSWLSADPYRGTMTDPGSLARYAYVEGNPATYQDLLGYMKADPREEARELHRAQQYVANGSNWKPGYGPSSNNSFKTDRHPPTCGAGKPGCGSAAADPWTTFWTAAGLAGSIAGDLFLGQLRGLLNGAASFGNAVINNPDLLLVVILGVLAVQGGIAGGAGGVALSGTGVGAIAGGPAVVASAALAAAGAAAAAAALAALGAEAAGNSKIEPWKQEENPLANNGSGPKDVTPKEQTAINEVKKNPQFGDEISEVRMNDPRWPAEQGWVKMERRVQMKDGSEVKVHWNRNEVTGEVADFKPKR